MSEHIDVVVIMHREMSSSNYTNLFCRLLSLLYQFLAEVSSPPLPTSTSGFAHFFFWGGGWLFGRLQWQCLCSSKGDLGRLCHTTHILANRESERKKEPPTHSDINKLNITRRFFIESNTDPTELGISSSSRPTFSKLLGIVGRFSEGNTMAMSIAIWDS